MARFPPREGEPREGENPQEEWVPPERRKEAGPQLENPQEEWVPPERREEAGLQFGSVSAKRRGLRFKRGRVDSLVTEKKTLSPGQEEESARGIEPFRQASLSGDRPHSGQYPCTRGRERPKGLGSLRVQEGREDPQSRRQEPFGERPEKGEDYEGDSPIYGAESDSLRQEEPEGRSVRGREDLRLKGAYLSPETKREERVQGNREGLEEDRSQASWRELSPGRKEGMAKTAGTWVERASRELAKGLRDYRERYELNELSSASSLELMFELLCHTVATLRSGTERITEEVIKAFEREPHRVDPERQEYLGVLIVRLVKESEVRDGEDGRREDRRYFNKTLRAMLIHMPEERGMELIGWLGRKEESYGFYHDERWKCSGS